ncbi:hypothetical protein AUR67_07745 [Pseudoalteromonas sp. XI10]|uniref:hypothetical protein n=1 Tax=Pseudoalteromonas TaxID=53246 RepID=UPI000733626F|nr:hypothetical protein [Pseudoalteromonas sp. XI10]KTG21222.1 hypothetical protein AUR67_07745 [Pseudoalteromonas sp. XI10]
MESPEIFLKELNAALRRLRGACNILESEEIDLKLLAVMRKLLLAETLGNKWIIAVGGSQGAGKTTLMSKVYSCEKWLCGNEGRGEKLPVLISESKYVHEPQGYVNRLVEQENQEGLVLKEIEVDVKEFNKVITDPAAEDLLPILKVPPRFFKRSNQAFLLLPGYEKQDRENKNWQSLMRQAMIAAGGCLIVTDETRMANQQQLEIAKDMMENELEHCKPNIVITKTEAYESDLEKSMELKNSAVKTFGLNKYDIETNVLLTGVDSTLYCEQWMPKFQAMINNLNFTGQSKRALQIKSLSEILGNDLKSVLRSINSRANIVFRSSEVTEGQLACEEILNIFDIAVEDLKIEHKKEVKNHIREVSHKATDKLDKKLINDAEGFKNWVWSAFDTSTETKQKFETLVQCAWNEASSDFIPMYAEKIQKLTIGNLGRQDNFKATTSRSVNLESGNVQNLIKLGYLDSSGQPYKFAKLTENVKSDIKIILSDQLTASGRTSKDLYKSVRLLPLLSLEYARLSFFKPKLITEEMSDSPINDSYGNVIEDGVDSFSKGVKEGRNVLKAVAGILAVDIISDGDSDILETIFGQSKESKESNVDAPNTTNDTQGGSTPPVMLHPAAVAVTAVLAACYLTVKTVTGIRKEEKEIRSYAQKLLNNIQEQHFENFCSSFDEIMRVTRSRLESTLRQRYHLDEALMRRERLAKSSADVRVLTNDLKESLDSSANDLNAFNPDLIS